MLVQQSDSQDYTYSTYTCMGTFGAYFDFKGSTYLIHTIDCLCTVCTYMHAALADKEYQAAYQLHVSLMVDHAGEVSGGGDCDRVHVCQQWDCLYCMTPVLPMCAVCPQCFLCVLYAPSAPYVCCMPPVLPMCAVCRPPVFPMCAV